MNPFQDIMIWSVHPFIYDEIYQLPIIKRFTDIDEDVDGVSDPTWHHLTPGHTLPKLTNTLVENLDGTRIFMAKLVKDRELSVFTLLKFRDSKYFAIIKKTNTKMDKIADFTKFGSSFMARRL